MRINKQALLGMVVAVAVGIASGFYFRPQPACATFFDTGIPEGVCVPWFSTDTAPPKGWHLCDGSTVTLLTGPHAGASVTLPNTIGVFVIGSDLASGSATANPSGFGHIANQATGGSITHHHSLATVLGVPGSDSAQVELSSSLTGNTSTQPYSLGMPMIMKL